MSSNNNFLLKIHMEEEDNIKEIFLNKERRSFTFVNDECVSDLVMPKFKISSLNMILKNINENQGSDKFYAEYEKDDELVREYDKEKINLLVEMITKININDFFEHLGEIKVIDYYVDNIVDAYNCVLPIEMKQLLSYTTNGVVFGSKDKIYMMPHDDIVNYNKEIKNFIPLMIKNETNYIGFDYNDSLYKEYVNNESINESKTLKGVVITSQIEVLDLDEVEEKEDTDAFAQELREKIDEELDKNPVNTDYENTIRNIELQLEKLNVGLIVQKKKEEYQYVEKKNEEKIKIKNEIVDSIRKSIREIEENQTKNDSEKITIKKNNIKDKSKKKKEEPKKDVVKTPRIREIKNKDNDKLSAFLEEYNKSKQEEQEEVFELDEEFNAVLDDHAIDEEIKHEVDEEFDKVLDEHAMDEEIKHEIDESFNDTLNKSAAEILTLEEMLEIDPNYKEEPLEKDEEFEKVLDEHAIDEEIKHEVDLEFDNTLEQIKEEVKTEEKEAVSLNELIINSIEHGINNYKINFNDTQKLVVEHLPYCEMSNSFGVIQIPEIEVDKITLLPDGKLDLGKIKLVVSKLSSNKVELLIQTATNIVDSENNKLKVGSSITLDLSTELTFRLNKKGAMETWTLKMEKSTFEKELRNIDYAKVMNLISKLEGYKKLGNIEKYELQKSVMLFIDFVMRYNEQKDLEELYRILEKEPTLYEEYITKYNIKHALEMKNSLSTYDSKKEFVTKLNYVEGLIDAKWLDYPRYIFKTHNYFSKDEFLQDFLEDLNISLKEEDFADYLKKLFKEYDMFKDLDEVGRDNLDKCLEYLSVLYKYNLYLGEKYKYEIEKTFMIGATEEDIALLISKLCRRGIKDYSFFIEYDVMMKNKYRLGELKYPIFSESFGIEEIRNGGEYDEY